MEKYVICDDSAFVRESLYDILKKEGGQNITLAKTGKQLLETIAKEIPYLVLLDINLPDKSGLELLQNIKSKYDIVKVIMVTADNSDETKEKALQPGADKYITKPFLPEQIITALEAVK
ncbi:MAG: response regulator [Lachnospiraceae bacterium]|nr:response regulator [Lachnospiraceae bacterium]